MSVVRNDWGKILFTIAQFIFVKVFSSNKPADWSPPVWIINISTRQNFCYFSNGFKMKPTYFEKKLHSSLGLWISTLKDCNIAVLKPVCKHLVSFKVTVSKTYPHQVDSCSSRPQLCTITIT